MAETWLVNWALAPRPTPYPTSYETVEIAWHAGEASGDRVWMSGSFVPQQRVSFLDGGNIVIDWFAASQTYRGSNIVTFETAPTGNLLLWLETHAEKQTPIPVLAAPVITLSGDILSITDADGNAEQFDIYADGVYQTSVQKPASMPSVGQLITMNLDGTNRQYRVLKVSGKQAEVVSMYNVNDSIAFASSGNTYENGTLDTYLNTTWYNTLSATAKAAIVDKTFTQDSWYSSNTGSPDYAGKNSSNAGYTVSLGATVYPTGVTSMQRHVYLLSVQDIIDYLGVTPEMTAADTTLTYNNVWTMFWNDTSPHTSAYIWLLSASAANASRACYVNGGNGSLNSSSATGKYIARAAFQIDLSKISWS